MSYQQEKQLAIAAVTAAAQLCEQVRQEQGSSAMKKPDRSPVTVADFGAQAVICQALASAFPEDPVVAEEDSAFLRSPANIEQLSLVTNYVQAQIPSATTEDVTTWIDRGNGAVASRYWTLDPIDGTKGYVRGDQYAIALALVEEGELKLGVLGCPALPINLTQPDSERGVIFVAVKGQGTTMISLKGGEPQSIALTNTDEVASRRLIESVEVEHGNAAVQKAVVQDIGLIPPSLRIDSMAKYGVVARGEAALYIRLPLPLASEKRQNIWDHAAGTIVLEEAGGRVTDMYGKPLDFSCGAKLFNNQGIIASNGVIHEAVLAAVAQRIK
ncbi:MAG: 3'(2'),5'-bisphosphate nucleotidase [Symploca sp. SIO1B1]|nr:3'(2'),5'-bisphosphate nucleotidase [Symploca sp. SIO1B1]